MTPILSKINSSLKGMTLVETLVGTALFLIIFLGIFGLIQLTFKVVGQSKARTTATALANQKVELVRNLPYDQVGTLGGIPAGTISQSETTTLNGIIYSVKTTITYVDDPFDGTFPLDPLPWDYKRAKVAVSWTGFLGGQVTLLTDVSPKGIETTGGGGIISILVFDANGQPVPQASIHVDNSVVSPIINADYLTNNGGQFFLPGAPACNDCYKISATKSGFNSDRTYASGEIVRGQTIATPTKPLVSVINNQLSEVSFSIDRLSTKTVQSIKYSEEKTWNDSFDDLSKIDMTFQTIASTTLGTVQLDQVSGQYFLDGYLTSVTITPVGLVEWGRLNWSDIQPLNTTLKYHLLYATSSTWELIPDVDLTVGGVKNSDGFSAAPVDLSDLDTVKYKSVKIRANLSTTDANITPTLSDWQLTWFSSDITTPIPNFNFSMRGAKTLGNDSSGNPVYKFQESFSTDATGQIAINNLEWDSYKITAASGDGYDIANSLPAQPVNVNPNSNQTTVFKLAGHQANTLLVTVRNSGGLPLVGASVQLYKTGYDKLKLSSDSGQVFFSPLSNAVYTLEIKMAGFQDWSNPITINGQSEQATQLTIP